MKPYYEDSKSGIAIYHGDCEAILPELPEVDLFFTSPPYNLGVTAGGGFAGVSKFHRNHGHYDPNGGYRKRGGGGKWNGGDLADGYGAVHDDKMPWAKYEEWQRRILKLCWSKLSDDGAIFYNHKPRAQSREIWLPTALNPGLPLRQIITWARAGGVNFSPTHYLPMYEWILLFAKPEWRLRDKAASGVGDVWRVTQESNVDHPAPFPIGLPLRAIETSRPGLICDPFCGSGTTLRASKDLGRKAIGIEINEKYCELAASRLCQEVFAMD